MTTYTAITNGEIDQDSPVTQPLFTAIRDNPIAMFEGAPGAPKLLPRALSSNGLGGISFNTTGWAGYTNLSTVKRMRFQLYGAVSTGAVSGTLRVRFSDNNGTSWGAAQSTTGGVAASVSRTDAGIFLEIDLVTGAYITILYSSASAVSLETGTLTPLANCNGVQIGFVNGTSNLAGAAYVMEGL